MFKVIVAGSRHFDDYPLLCWKLDRLLAQKMGNVEIVCGKARGADSLGEQYAKERGIPIRYFPADWQTLGKSAGYQRNVQMAAYADALVAFWDGKSKGTKHMIETAQRHRLNVRVVLTERGELYGKTTEINKNL